MPDEFSALDAWFEARDRKKEPKSRVIKKRKSLGEDFELSIPGGVPQVIHATKTVGEATTVEHVEFTAENWQRWIKDPEYSRMYTHPTTECVSPKEVVRRARREAGLE